MQYLKSTITIILAAATLVSADTTSTTLADNPVNTICDSENILQQCTQRVQSNLASCAPDDWNCQCTSSTNLVECYINCPDDTSRKDAESTRQQICAKAKAPASLPASTSAVSSTRAAATGTADIDDGNYIPDSEVDSDFEGHPTKSYSGLEANLIPRLEEGTASGLRMGGWLEFLGLVVGIVFQI
ncbi:GPI anchored serine-threonine rich protein [Penicillium digitatum]|uniref:GPI anchored serine-threonine rich protein n=3 Tax=Penicillium digitatum TaxID=36651 RepID=K9FU30_PEND2|nr:GPI anchored serine-threonine rich protein [Penicillium digitatum Pd1]EKV12639.1 GPI anchored serine-threonine rich protein [Penicillium digitatum PHI26]EKV15217.1 GPI anchored serine-threonine rich protein [Penicillium digitatum Pd1]QQK46521.1 GPI anchored serine-threonine rich protein [Penicillium digitatum]